MPDTGAPWNIPYVEPSDLVRNYPAANELMADAIAAGLTAANIGIGSNVVRATDTTDRTTTSASPVDLGTLTVTITPTKTDSRILLIAAFRVNTSATGNTAISLFSITNAANTAISGAEAVQFGTSSGGLTSVLMADNIVIFAEDSPATTAATTYKCRFLSQSPASTTVANASSTGQMFAIEVAA